MTRQHKRLAMDRRGMGIQELFFQFVVLQRRHLRVRSAFKLVLYFEDGVLVHYLPPFSMPCHQCSLVVLGLAVSLV
jgi:hypothetical protein